MEREHITTPGSPDGTASRDTALYPGDTGELSLETRQVLVRLLTGPSLDGQRQPKLWPVLLRHEDVLRSRLHELFLELIIDRDLEIAFVRQVESDELDIPALLRSARLTFLESALLLDLRAKLLEAQGEGRRAVVSLDDMLGWLQVYGNPGSTDLSGTEKRYRAAIKKMEDFRVVRELDTPGRFEVSPVLKLIFSTEQVKELTRVYREISGKSREGELEGLDEQQRAKVRLAEDMATMMQEAIDADSEVEVSPAGDDSGEERR